MRPSAARLGSHEIAESAAPSTPAATMRAKRSRPGLARWDAATTPHAIAPNGSCVPRSTAQASAASAVSTRDAGRGGNEASSTQGRKARPQPSASEARSWRAIIR